MSDKPETLPPSVAALATDDALTCPFPGFRPFDEDERRFFFGRKQPTYDIIDRLGHSSFVAVVGASGSGKSSLVRCGVLPALHRGLLGPAGHRWRISRSRPLNDPIGELAAGIVGSGIWPESGGYEQDMVEAVLRRGPRGIIEVAEQSLLNPRENLLVFIDQFEELFAYAERRDPNAPRDDLSFVQLLLEAAAQTRQDLEDGDPATRPRVFVLITMRSDFLGDCTPYEGLPAWLNEGFFLTPLLDRDQRRQIIEGPLAMTGAPFTKRLVNRLLNDAGEDPSMLPPLQHALMRTWTAWAERQPDYVETGDARYRGPETRGSKRDAIDRDPIDVADYTSHGTGEAGRESTRKRDGESNRDTGLEGVLCDHLDEILEELTDHQVTVAERVFRRLTEVLQDGKVLRCAATLAELAAVCGVEPDDEDLRVVLDAFRREGRTFLAPRIEVDEEGNEIPLKPTALVDISHESLIRSWKTLRDCWLVAEAESAAIYRPLSERAHARKRTRDAAAEGKAGDGTKDEREGKAKGRSVSPYRGAELNDALRWRRSFDDATQAEAWAEPYDRRARRPGGFKAALDFLEWSYRRRVERIETSGVILLTLLAAGGWWWNADRIQRRIAENRQQLELAEGLTEIDPLLGARTLGQLAGEDDVEGRGERLALRVITENLPERVLSGFAGSIRALSFDEGGESLLVVSDEEGEGRRASLYELQTGMLTTVLADPGFITGWLEGAAGTLVLEGAGSAPSGWRRLTVPGGWIREGEAVGTGVGIHRSPGGSFLAARYTDPVPHACVWALGGEASIELPPCGPGSRRIELPRARGMRFTSDSTLVMWGGARQEGRSVGEPPRIAVASLHSGDSISVDSVEVPVGTLPGRRTALDEVLTVAFHAETNTLAAGLRSGALRLWNRSDPRRSSCADSLGAAPLSLEFLAGEEPRLLSVSEAGSIALWAVNVGSIADSPGGATSCGSSTAALVRQRDVSAVGPTAALAATSFDPTGMLYTFGETRGAVRALRIDGRGSLAWDAQLSVRGHRSPVRIARLDPSERRLATADADGELRIWSTGATRWATAESVPEVEGASGEGGGIARSFWRMAATPTGSLIAYGTWGGDVVTLEATEAGTWSPSGPTRSFGGPVEYLTLAPEGDRVAVAVGDTLFVDGLGTPGQVPIPHEDSVRAVAFLDGGNAILSASLDGRVRVSLAATGDSLAGLRVSEDLRSAAVSNAGHLATGSGRNETVIDIRGIEVVGDERRITLSDRMARIRLPDTESLSGLSFSPGGTALAARLASGLWILVNGGDGDWEEAVVDTIRVDPISAGLSNLGTLRTAEFLTESRIFVRHDNAFVVWEIGPYGSDGAWEAVALPAVWEPGGITAPSAVAAESREAFTLRREETGGTLKRWPLGWNALAERLRELTDSTTQRGAR